MSSKLKQYVFDNGLVVKHRKHAIIFETIEGESGTGNDFKFTFSPDTFREFVDYIIKIADEAWANITPKEADSLGSDYYEYYDKLYDNNGYLSISKCELVIESPYGSVDKLYQFNKPKIQSFIYDLLEIVKQADKGVVANE